MFVNPLCTSTEEKICALLNFGSNSWDFSAVQIALHVSLMTPEMVDLPILKEKDKKFCVSPVAKYLRHKDNLSLADIGLLDLQW